MHRNWERRNELPRVSPVLRKAILNPSFAYVISVAYYLTLLSAFVLKASGHPDPLTAKLVTTSLLLVIAGIGAFRGLQGLERMEVFAVSFNLAVIFGLLVSLAIFHVTGAAPEPHSSEAIELGWPTIRIILGLLIVVQGFETSKFLDSEYDADTRIQTMRRAQWISCIIYLAFFALITPLLPLLGASDDVTAIVDLVGHVALVLPLAITLGAMASQFSASVADTIGASGLLHNISGNRIAMRHTYPLIGLVSVFIVWETNVNELIALASRAFALFYAIQCVVAVMAAARLEKSGRNVFQIAGFSTIGLICILIVLFGAPAES